MANILIVGSGPLPGPELERTGAAALRTWQVARPMFESPHTVKLIALPEEIQPENGRGTAKEEVLEHEAFPYTMLSLRELPKLVDYLNKVIAEFEPACLIAVNAWPAYVLAQAPTHLPLWVDLPGLALAEAQVRAERMQAETPVVEAWEREKAILLRADKFSAASMPQLYALLGELGMVGRLNHLTAQYHFAHHIPYAVHPFFARPPAPVVQPLLRREVVPADAFVVLWSGGFDACSDVETLVAALDKAMALNPKLHFVATGGGSAGGDEMAYLRMTAAIEAGPFAARHHLLGWVEVGRLPQIYRECDLGLSVDGMSYETLFGSRFRLLNMMAAGLPVASALGTELSHILNEEHIGMVFPAGDADALCELLLRAARNVNELRAMGQRGRNYATRHFSSTALCRPMRQWVDLAELAPDNASKAAGLDGGRRLQDVPINAIEEEVIGAAAGEGRMGVRPGKTPIGQGFLGKFMRRGK